MSRRPSHDSGTRPLSHTDEARARTFLVAPVSGLDDLALGKGFLAKALATIEQQRATIAELTRELERVRETAPTEPSDTAAVTRTKSTSVSDTARPLDLSFSATTAAQLEASAGAAQSVLGPFADVPAEGLVSSAFGVSSREMPHLWTDADVKFELSAARESEALAMQLGAGADGGQAARAWIDVARWHRARAQAIALLIQHVDARDGWFHAEHVLTPFTTRTAPFVGGPFDAVVATVIDPPRTIFVAHRPDGSAVAQAYLVHEVHGTLEPGAPLPDPPRSGGRIIGWYRWSSSAERFDWVAAPRASIAHTHGEAGPQ